MTCTELYGPRTRPASVWCCCFLRCKGIDVPGYAGNGQPELCDACERERLAEAERANTEPERREIDP